MQHSSDDMPDGDDREDPGGDTGTGTSRWLFLIALLGHGVALFAPPGSWPRALGTGVGLLVGGYAVFTTGAQMGFGPVTRVVSLLLVLIPVVSFIPLLFGLLASPRAMLALSRHTDADAQARDAFFLEAARRQAAQGRARVQAQTPAPRSASPPPATPPSSPPPRSGPADRASRVRYAIPYIKHLGLTECADGEILSVRLTPRPGLPALTDDNPPVVRAAKRQFGVFYALDEGTHYSFVTRGDMQAAGLTPERLHETALNNLIDVVAGHAPQGGGPSDERVTHAAPLGDATNGPATAPRGLSIERLGASYAMALGHTYEPSLLLLDDLWDGLAKRLTPNGAIVAIPRRDTCVFCDAASAQGLEDLRGMVAAAAEQTDLPRLSDQLYRRVAGTWVVVPA